MSALAIGDGVAQVASYPGVDEEAPDKIIEAEADKDRVKQQGAEPSCSACTDHPKDHEPAPQETERDREGVVLSQQ